MHHHPVKQPNLTLKFPLAGMPARLMAALAARLMAALVTRLADHLLIRRAFDHFDVPELRARSDQAILAEAS
jgi:hypothetical protein